MGYFEEHKEKICNTPGGKLCQVFGENENADCSVALVKMFDNSRGVLHYHKRITEIYCFSNGTGTININGNEHEIINGDCYIITPTNSHIIQIENAAEFMCICIPPWTEKLEFKAKDFSKNEDISKCNKCGVIFDNGKVIVESYCLVKNEMKSYCCKEYKREVIYFQSGNGIIAINGNESAIHEAECFEIKEGQKVEVIAKSDLKYIIVRD